MKDFARAEAELWACACQELLRSEPEWDSCEDAVCDVDEVEERAIIAPELV